MSAVWLKELKINDSVDVFDDTQTINCWILGRVIDLDETQIKVHYYSWNDRYDEWINKDDDKLSILNCHTPLCKIKKYAQIKKDISNTISVHPNGKSIFYQSGNEIIQYNINDNKFKHIACFKFNDYEDIEAASISNDTLYFVLFKRVSDKITVWSLYLNTLKWNKTEFKWDKLPDRSRTKLYIVNRVFHLFIIDWSSDITHHLILDHDAKKAISITSYEETSFYNVTQVIPDTNMIISTDRKHACLNMYSLDGEVIKVKFPENEFNSDRLIYSSIIIYNHIFCVCGLDLIYDIRLRKWHKTKKIIPNMRCTFVNGYDNYLYACCQSKYVIKLDLLDIIPFELYKEYKSVDGNHHKLVYGYINQYICEFDMENRYSLHLSNMILSYFPSFLYF